MPMPEKSQKKATPPLRPPLYWRRWTFLASALFNLLFVVFSLGGVRFSYAAVHGQVTLLGRITQVLFWLALLLAMAADACIAAGWLEHYYHRLLDLILFCNMFCFGLIATAELLLSLMLHAGFSEPLMVWLLIIPYQFLTVRSAHESPPPGRLDWPTNWQIPKLTGVHAALLHLEQRLQRAATAFRDDSRDDSRDEPHDGQ